MRNLKIRWKFSILVAFLLVSLLIVGSSAIALMDKINEGSTVLADKWLPSISIAGRIDVLTSDYRLQEYSYVIANNDSDRIALDKEMTNIHDDINFYFSQYEALIENDAERNLFENAKSSWEEYFSYSQGLKELIKDGRKEDALQLLYTESKPLFDKTSDALIEIVNTNEENGNQASLDGDETYSSAKATTIVSLIIITLISVITSTYIILLVVRPVHELDKIAVDIANGNLDKEIKYKSKDELGKLATNFNKTVRRLKDYVNYIDEVSSILDEIADGNLVFTLKYKYDGEFEKVKKALLNISDTLNGTLSQINQSAEQVASGSDQVSSGAQTLSQGATEQASSIEELAATITDVAEKIKLNATNAVDTGKKVSSLGDEIEISNEQMAKMMDAMGKIGSTSDEISKIIKTIEDIAFQTNILSLNAAVEAARAGEAGKGFAVVAEEVRVLASRSAEAANTTTLFIEDSLNAVRNGAKIADETAKCLQNVVDEANEVIKNVNVIATASEEQSDAVEQIRNGIDQISAVVQSNSATAEESAATSEELSGQAQILKELVGRFKLKGNYSNKYHSASNKNSHLSNYNKSSNDDIKIDLVYNPDADLKY